MTVVRRTFRRWGALALVGLVTGCGGGGPATTDTTVEGGTGTGGAAGPGGAGGTGGASGKGGAGASTTKGAGGFTAMGGGAAGAAAKGGGGGASGSAGFSGGAGSGGSPVIICTPDDDGDQIPNDVEGKNLMPPTDTDGDGIPDYLDLDSDNDTIPDLLEGDTKDLGCSNPIDSDADGVPDYRDTDSDNNGLDDIKEVYPDGMPYSAAKGPPADTNKNKIPDYADPDNDGDSLPDKFELMGMVNGVPPDTNKDGIPDLDDVDSDGDTIYDGYEGQGDFDMDGVPNFRSLDSDGDGVPDKCEAGAKHLTVMDKPADTNMDGKFDFLQLDSDGDGLLDKDEDKNGNCIVDPGETDRIKADTDGDGADDLVEVTLGTDPLDPNDFPELHGKYWIKVPYNAPPFPAAATVPILTKLQKVDLGFVMDTNGSMNGARSALQTGIAFVAAEAQKAIPDVAFGVVAHEDFPVQPYGLSTMGDLPFYIPPGGVMTTKLSDTTMAVNGLTLHNGGDAPESQVLAMWRAVTGGAYMYPGQIVAADALIPIATRFGSLQFRKDAIPLLLSITNSPFHNGRDASMGGATHDPYSFNPQQPYPVPLMDDLVKAMNSEGVRFMGIAVDDGARNGFPYNDLAYLSDKTSSNVPPYAFGGSTCNTGLGGNTLPAPDGPGGTCRLVFDINKNGTGLNDRIVDGIKALLKTIVFDVRIIAISDQPSPMNGNIDSIDTFVDHIEVVLMGGQDIAQPTVPCIPISLTKANDKWTGPKGMQKGGDGFYEGVKAVVPTTKLCFSVVPTPNTTVPSIKTVQKFHAVLQLRAAKNTNGGEVDFGPPREMLFLVPPSPQLRRHKRRRAPDRDDPVLLRRLVVATGSSP